MTCIIHPHMMQKPYGDGIYNYCVRSLSYWCRTTASYINMQFIITIFIITSGGVPDRNTAVNRNTKVGKNTTVDKNSAIDKNSVVDGQVMVIGEAVFVPI